MRAVILVLLLVVAGCAQQSEGVPLPDERVMPADFAGTVEFRNGSVPPPYHYEWRLRFDESSAEIEWRPGYDEATQPWLETADLTDDQREQVYQRLWDLGLFDMAAAGDDGSVGGSTGRVEITARGDRHDPGTLGLSDDSGQLLDDVVAAVRDLLPADVWSGMEAKQEEWSAQHQ